MTETKKQLEQKLAESTIKLERMSRANADFVSIVSHDLKTPLTGIKLFADLLINELKQPDKEAPLKYLGIIKAEADRMTRVLANATDFQKIYAGKMEWHDKDTEIVKIIAKCADLFQVLCKIKQIDFVFEREIEELSMRIDADRLMQVVYNLLANALKHTSQGRISIRIRRITAADAKLSITVSDTGAGIESDKLKALLKTSSDSPNINQGMGLYVAKHTIEHYRGKIRAQSRVGEGSVFFVELPV